MDLSLVYIKTDKGREEIARRTFRLDFKRRALLIMVDGVKSGLQLVASTANLGDSTALFQALVDEGFIADLAAGAGSVPALRPGSAPGEAAEVSAAGAPTGVVAAPVEGPAAPDAGPTSGAPTGSVPPRVGRADDPMRTFEQARFEVLRFLRRALGPEADFLAPRIERARTVEEFRVQSLRLVEVIRMARGVEVAAEFQKLIG